jgi:hypothetical protein
MRIKFDRKKNKRMMKLYIYIYNQKNNDQIWKIEKIKRGEIEKKIITL